jgi:cellobiose-specific phosphotransferase system component IIA
MWLIWRETCNGKCMILIITASASGQQCVEALKAATNREVQWAQNLQQAAAHLREQTYSAAVIDQFLLETEPEESDQMLEHLGTAFPVYVNFAVTGLDRLVREVRSALHRRKREEAAARRAVEDQLRSEMGETVTALLLSCELAMSLPGIPAPAAEKIQTIDSLARELRGRLEAR